MDVLLSHVAVNTSQMILAPGTSPAKHSLESKSRPESSLELDVAFLVPLS